MKDVTLPQLIEDHAKKLAEYRSCYELDDSADATNDSFDAKEDAEHAVLRLPCRSLDEVRTKASFALADDMVLDSLLNCTIDDEPVLTIFLRSLLGEGGGS